MLEKSFYVIKNAKTSDEGKRSWRSGIFRSRWEFIKGPCSVHYSKIHSLNWKRYPSRFDDRGLPWELLYADDLVLLADSEDGS